jgi:NADPH-dependent 2,4-dienoyl-CoA reductase/sulfur reductase-like enzyme
VLSKETYGVIDRPKLSKSLLTDLKKLHWRTPELLRDELQIDFRPGTVVTKVDTSQRTVTTEAGDTVSYTSLVLATGGTPRQLPLPGFKELGNVFTLRTVQSAEAIVSATSGGRKKVWVLQANAPLSR